MEEFLVGDYLRAIVNVSFKHTVKEFEPNGGVYIRLGYSENDADIEEANNINAYTICENCISVGGEYTWYKYSNITTNKTSIIIWGFYFFFNK